jgi:putative transposase
MPWKEVIVMDEKKEFIEQYLKGSFAFSRLCQQFCISRKTGYKWIARYESLGLEGLCEQSRVPHNQINVTSEDVINLIIGTKAEFSNWGPKKIHAYLMKHYQLEHYPCKTTVENVLKRNGLVKSRKYRRRFASKSSPLSHCQSPNDIWCTDFKGWSLTNDGQRFGPYTLMDADSRFLISCVRLAADDTDHVWAVMEKAFYENGLPLIIRSDNGPPFATSAPGRLSNLAIKLIKAGVTPEWTEPGHPEQNGRQERMHLTLQSEAISKELPLREQIQKMDEFREYYNFVRPHEAIEQRCPGDIYTPSSRQWHGRLRSPEYPDCYKVGKVKSCGKMSWAGGEVYISRVFEGEPIGIYEREKGLTAYYGPVELGVIKGNILEFERRASRKQRKDIN